jgi:putative zinc finger protein
MTGCDHVRTEIGAYVLNALEPAEAEAVREHLARCSECAAEHARLAGLPALLSLAEHMEDAPPLTPAVEERVLDAVAREAPHSRRRRRLRLRMGRPLMAVAATAAAAAAAVLAIVVLTGGSGDGGGGYQVRLQPVSGAAAAGRAELSSQPSGTTLRLWVRNLPPDPDVVYEVQCDAPGWTATAGTFRADTRGRAYAVLTTAMRRGEYDAIRVVRRSRSRTTDVLTASLH